MTHHQNQYTALLLGSAVQKIFPRETYYGSGIDRLGFFATFTYSEPFDPSLLSMIEKTMKEERGKASVSEMAVAAARELFLHFEQEGLLERLAGHKGTVLVGRIGDFTDLVEGDLELTPHFLLTGSEQQNGLITLRGRAFTSDKERKTYAKRRAKHVSHEKIARELELYEKTEKGILWYPRGIALRNLLQDHWSKALLTHQIPQLILPKTADSRLAKEKRLYPFAQGAERKLEGPTLFSDPMQWSGDIFMDHPEIFSEFLADFPIETRWMFFPSNSRGQDQPFKKVLPKGYKEGPGALDGPRLELQGADSLGQFWPISRLEKVKGGYRYALVSGLEELIALLLEATGGELPFWLAPEQIRLIPLDEVDPAPVIALVSGLGLRYQIEKASIKLGEKVHRALRTKVPYGIVFGKREEAAQIVSVRARTVKGSSSDEKMTHMQLKELLLQRKNEH